MTHIYDVSSYNGKSISNLWTKENIEKGRFDSFFDNNQIINLKDVTDYRKIQAEMEKMNRFSTIAEIASAVAHEVRNPLAGIMTMSQAIDEQMAEGDNKKEYIGRIIRQAGTDVLHQSRSVRTHRAQDAEPSGCQRKSNTDGG